MLYIRLSGGLGNQIFQLGAGLILAKNNNINKIIVDDSALGHCSVKRKNELLNLFSLNISGVSVEYRTFFLSRYRIPKFSAFLTKRLSFISDKNFTLSLKRSNLKNIYLDGYFQFILSQKIFEFSKNLMSNSLIKNEINKQKENACVIHIRGGDFINLGWNEVTPAQYYIDAIDMMTRKFGIKEFTIVTDDKAYAEFILNKLNYKFKFLLGNALDDFHTISDFNYRILSSSTFSFWASAMGSNKKGGVIMPKFWLPGKERLLCLENEMRIKDY